MEARGLSSASDEFILHLIGFAVLLMSQNELISSGKFKLCPRKAKCNVRALNFNHSII